MKKLGVNFLALGITLIAVMTWLEGYISILSLMRNKVEGSVLAYQQDSPGKVREGDWRMKYEYVSDDGQVFQGETTFPPNKRPDDSIESVTVLYFPLRASISDVEGNVTTTGLLGYLLSIYLIVQGIRFCRGGDSFPKEATDTQE